MPNETPRPTKPVYANRQHLMPHQEIIRIQYDPRTAPEWLARYSADLEQTLARMEARIEELEGHRGRPQICAPLSLLGNTIHDVGDPDPAKPQDVVTVGFLQKNALIKNADGSITLSGTLNGNGNPIINIGRAPLSPDVQTTAEILAMIAARFATGSFVITGTGFAVNPTGTARYAVVNSALVILFLPDLSSTSNAATFTLTGMPAAIQPTQASNHVVTVTDGEGGGAGTTAYGLLQLAAGSLVITLVSPVTSDGSWTASGQKKCFATSIAYVLT